MKDLTAYFMAIIAVIGLILFAGNPCISTMIIAGLPTLLTIVNILIELEKL